MKKTILVVAISVLLLALTAGIAVAVTKTCSGDPCKGTKQRDWLAERVGDDLDDTISGLAKGDTISANEWTNDKDDLRGNKGNDKLFANDGDFEDFLRGGPGKDTCVVDEDPANPGEPLEAGISSCEKVIVADPGVGPASQNSQ